VKATKAKSRTIWPPTNSRRGNKRPFDVFLEVDSAILREWQKSDTELSLEHYVALREDFTKYQIDRWEDSGFILNMEPVAVGKRGNKRNKDSRKKKAKAANLVQVTGCSDASLASMGLKRSAP
jgi:hypothetical protein